MTTPKVQYSYADGSANTIRPTRTTYPDGREMNLDYGSAGGMDDLLSRVGAIVDDDGVIHLTDASYLGLGTPVITDFTQPDVMYTLVGTAGGNDPDTGDIYRGLDRFGRVKDACWRDYGANTDAARIQYGYDRAGNRTYRADPVAVANGAQYEELYGYDAIHRLKTMDRGTLNSTKTALTAKSFDQCWTLDPTGNWKGFRQDDTGDGAWDLIQARTSNPVNEITNIANSVGAAWANPAYDAAGNMTTIPQPADPTKSYTAQYDAWNRLVKLQDGANTVAEYQYDARNYRTVQKTYTAGTLTETRHFYYSSNWQVLEERTGTSPDSAPAERQFVWGLRYIDDCVLRDRDTDGNGTLDERLYALQDANWNVIALTDTSGDVQERYAYQAYGTTKFLTPSFGNRSSSSFGWETLYCGYRLEAANKLYSIRNRSYNSVFGTFSRRDHLGNIPSSLYFYIACRPLIFTDPTGYDLPIMIPESGGSGGSPHKFTDVNGFTCRADQKCLVFLYINAYEESPSGKILSDILSGKRPTVPSVGHVYIEIICPEGQIFGVLGNHFARGFWPSKGDRPGACSLKDDEGYNFTHACAWEVCKKSVKPIAEFIIKTEIAIGNGEIDYAIGDCAFGDNTFSCSTWALEALNESELSPIPPNGNGNVVVADPTALSKYCKQLSPYRKP